MMGMYHSNFEEIFTWEIKSLDLMAVKPENFMCEITWASLPKTPLSCIGVKNDNTHSVKILQQKQNQHYFRSLAWWRRNGFAPKKFHLFFFSFNSPCLVVAVLRGLNPNFNNKGIYPFRFKLQLCAMKYLKTSLWCLYC